MMTEIMLPYVTPHRANQPWWVFKNKIFSSWRSWDSHGISFILGKPLGDRRQEVGNFNFQNSLPPNWIYQQGQFLEMKVFCPTCVPQGLPHNNWEGGLGLLEGNQKCFAPEKSLWVMTSSTLWGIVAETGFEPVCPSILVLCEHFRKRNRKLEVPLKIFFPLWKSGMLGRLRNSW